MNIYLDIETVPAQLPETIRELRADIEAQKKECTAPANYKDQAKITEYIAAKHAELDACFDQVWRKTSFDGRLGQIACISIAINDAEPVTFYSEKWASEEQSILGDAFNYLAAETMVTLSQGRVSGHPTCFIGHNIVSFDLPFLYKRAVIGGVRPPAFIPFDARPWDGTVYDTMVKWAGVKERVSMDKLCRSFGIPPKGDIDGSKVWDYIRDGRIAEVADYCADDVRRVRAIHRRMNFA